jgi:hypothetical protein
VSATRGRAGEEAVLSALATRLDDRFLAIDRLRLPGTEADVDLVVVAARLVSVEVKTYRGPRRYRCEGRIWTYADRGGEWWPLDGSPGAQASFGALRVRRRLADTGIAIQAQGVVAWSGDAPLDLSRPHVPGLTPTALAGWLAEIGPGDPARVERIGRVLLP